MGEIAHLAGHASSRTTETIYRHELRIPEPNGEVVTTRYTLRALLDKLDELLRTNLGGT